MNLYRVWGLVELTDYCDPEAGSDSACGFDGDDPADCDGHAQMLRVRGRRVLAESAQAAEDQVLAACQRENFADEADWNSYMGADVEDLGPAPEHLLLAAVGVPTLFDLVQGSTTQVNV